jgi:hypothetical protein
LAKDNKLVGKDQRFAKRRLWLAQYSDAWQVQQSWDDPWLWRAGSPKRTIKGIGKTRIERKIFIRIGVHLIWSNVIKPFRRLIIPSHKFRSQISRKFADRI